MTKSQRQKASTPALTAQTMENGRLTFLAEFLFILYLLLFLLITWNDNGRPTTTLGRRVTPTHKAIFESTKAGHEPTFA